jgi:hypothetical protein
VAVNTKNIVTGANAGQFFLGEYVLICTQLINIRAKTWNGRNLSLFSDKSISSARVSLNLQSDQFAIVHLCILLFVRTPKNGMSAFPKG